MSSQYLSNDGLKDDIESLWDKSLSVNTQKVYKSALSCFLTFLTLQGLCYNGVDTPNVTEELLIYFVTYCNRALKLRFETIKLYLAGVRFHCIKNSWPYPSENKLRLSYILRAIKKTQSNPKVKRLPITFNVLLLLCNSLDVGMYNPFIDLMLLCAFKTAFYGFLRVGEFTCVQSSTKHFVRICDVEVHHDFFTLTLLASKTDPFGKGVCIRVFENGPLYPVATMRKYLTLRLKQGANAISPLFICVNSDTDTYIPLTRNFFIDYLKQSLTRLGYNDTLYNGHSFRIGAATSAAKAGVQDHMIQVLGRWSSDCYTRYIHSSSDSLKFAQKEMSRIL